MNGGEWMFRTHAVRDASRCGRRRLRPRPDSEDVTAKSAKAITAWFEGGRTPCRSADAALPWQPGGGPANEPPAAADPVFTRAAPGALRSRPRAARRSLLAQLPSAADTEALRGADGEADRVRHVCRKIFNWSRRGSYARSLLLSVLTANTRSSCVSATGEEVVLGWPRTSSDQWRPHCPVHPQWPAPASPHPAPERGGAVAIRVLYVVAPSRKTL